MILEIFKIFKKSDFSENHHPPDPIFCILEILPEIPRNSQRFLRNPQEFQEMSENLRKFQENNQGFNASL